MFHSTSAATGASEPLYIYINHIRLVFTKNKQELIVQVSTCKLLGMFLLYLVSGAALFNCCCAVFGIHEYYVKPSEHNGEICPGSPCHTFNDYARNVHEYTWTDVIVRFLPGDHSLNYTFYVSNNRNLQLTSSELSGNFEKPKIRCSSGVGLVIWNVSNISITGLRMFFSAVPIHEDEGGLILTNTLNIRVDRVVVECQIVSEGCISIKGTLGNSVVTKSHFYDPKPTTIVFLSVSITGNRLLSNHLVISESSFKGAMLSAISVYLEETTCGLLELSHCITSGTGIGLHFIAERSTATVHIRHSLVTQHMSGGLQFYFREMAATEVKIISTIVSNNIEHFGDIGAGLTVHMTRVVDNGSYVVEVKNVSFLTNKHTAGKRLRHGSAVILEGVEYMMVSDCKFHNNTGSAICAYKSSVYLEGNNSFVGNTATAGGAIALLEGSQLVILNNSNTLFLDNYAFDVGGAIFVHNTPSLLEDEYISFPDMCSLFLLSYYNLFEYRDIMANIALNFTKNVGWNGGDAVFGEDVGLCGLHTFSLLSTMLHKSPRPTIEISEIHFDPDENETFSLVSSNPQRVCSCTNGRPDCTIVSINLSKYPGETFTIPLVVVGTNLGTVTGTVHSTFLHYRVNEIAPDNDELQNFQSILRSDGCKDLPYSVFSNNEYEVMLLTTTPATALTYCRSQGIPHNEDDQFLKHNLCINITLLPCPLGFKLHTTRPRCVCHPQLEEHKLTCNISDQTIQRYGSMWINTSFNNEGQTNGLIIHRNCPYDYCKHTQLNLNLEFPDEQCAFDRAGNLCGGCQGGLSLALGSSHCIPCSNNYLTLLIPIAIAGVVLVFFLKFLNITVSQGTLNGLIFYANIVKANEAMFFPPGQTNILTVFISWMNLDLGMEVCFVNGLNGYWKTWLQFVFPVYIWAITATIIIASYYSSRAAKIFGNNSVPVLATLFLLSYTKLLRTTITILTFTYLNYPDGSTVVIWSYDGNVPYFSLAHSLLFIVAIAFLSFLWLPYTGILLFKQILQRYTKYKVLRWMTRLKPFFDAYFGPFKDRRWYWVGTLLLARVCLLLTFAVVQDPNISVLAISLAASLILLSRTVIGNVYRKRYLSILENTFIQNLTVLSLVTLYVQASGGNQATVVYLSVATAFAQFIAIVIWHVLTKNKVKQLAYRLKQKVKPALMADRDTNKDTNIQPEQPPAVPRQPTCTVVALHELREPLLTE